MADLGRGFDIDDFRALMAKKGIARTNLYKLFITPPRALNARELNMPTNSDVEEIMLYCDTVTMPGLALATSDSRPYGYGPVELKAYAPTFNQLNASFIVDAKGFTLSFFRNWMRGIVNYTGEGKSYIAGGINAVRSGGRTAPFEVNFKSEYEADMELYVVSGSATKSNENSLQLEVVSKTKIIRAFPTMIGDVLLNYGVTDQYMTLPVTFSFFEWYADVLPNATKQLKPGESGYNNGEITTPIVNP